MNIRTSYIFPPIPDRSFDWSAYDDNTYDGTPGQPVGYGPTEKAAVEDLKDQLWDAIIADEQLDDAEVDRYCHKLHVEFEKVYEELALKAEQAARAKA